MPKNVDSDGLFEKYGGGGQKKGKSSKNKKKNREESGNVTESNRQNQSESSTSTKKTQFVNLMNMEGGDIDSVVQLPGRHACDCEASRHALINNCLGCGRIVCGQEGSGPCLFCGQLVCTKEEFQMLQEHKPSKAQTELQQRLFGEDVALENARSAFSHLTFDMKAGDAQDKAVALKDKLLQFDRESARRTRVIDDQSDYYDFEKNPFLSAEQREEMRRKKEELMRSQNVSRARAPKTYSLDFAGRKVFENETSNFHAEREAFGRIAEDPSSSALIAGNERSGEQIAVSEQFIDHAMNAIKQYSGAKYIPSSSDDTMNSPSVGASLLARCQQITDDYAAKIQGVSLGARSAVDSGMCLSVRQPFASLLVLGIKLHEGRSWYSPYRGRLWIAASSHPVDVQEACSIEKAYAMIWNNDLPNPFPDQWSLGCLLGCVHVIDCLPQEQYRIQFPDGEIEDPYVFICENAVELPLKLPVQGRPRIFKLEMNTHKAASKMLAQT